MIQAGTRTLISSQALAVALGAREPVLLWGAPGCGKSSLVMACAEAAGLLCETVIASIREPSDFSGLPVVDGDGSVRFAPPRWARRLEQAGTGVLFLDEISTAPPAVQAALLRVVIDREVGDLTLPKGVSVVAAANPPEQAASGWNLAAPLANRFCHLRLEPSAHEVAHGLTFGFTPPTVVVPRDTGSRLPIWRSLVGQFLRARPNLHLSVPDNEVEAGGAWPSPRTWDMTIRLAAAADSIDADESVRSQLIIGCIGDGAGFEFVEFIRNQDLPDPEFILADPERSELPSRPDKLYVLLTAVVAAVTSQLTPERFRAAWTVLGRAANQEAVDIAAVPALELARHQPPGPFAELGAIRPFVSLLRDAGLFDAQ